MERKNTDQIFRKHLQSIINGFNNCIHWSEKAKTWAAGVVANMAREPKGNDRDQVKAVAADVGDVAILNTYYIGKLLASDNPEEVAAGEAIGVIFPNQEGRGTHINVSGAGVARFAPNKENAIKFIEFLSSEKAQNVFAGSNFEYPVRPALPWHRYWTLGEALNPIS